MNSLFEPDKIIFLSFEQESSWKKKWLEQKIQILQNKLKILNTILVNADTKIEEKSRQYDCCSRARAPPPYVPQCIILSPISKQFSNPSKLVDSSYAPIAPIWKSDDDQELNILTPNANDSDSYFQEDDNQANFSFMKSYDVNNFNTNSNSFSTDIFSHDVSPVSSPSEKDGHQNTEKLKRGHATVPKFEPQRTLINSIIPTPQWTPCNHFMHIDEDDSAIKNELASLESARRKSHIEIEIIQKRIRKHQLNLPIDQVITHNFDDLKISLTNKEKKLDRKYKTQTYRKQIPPNWVPRSYDEPNDKLNEKEVETWKKLMKNELSKVLINNDALTRDVSLKQIRIRSSNEPSTSNSLANDDN